MNLFINYLLILIIFLPLVASLSLLFVPKNNYFTLKIISLIFTCVNFILSLLLWRFFNNSIGHFQFINVLDWIPFLNINFIVGLDGISLFLVILTNLLTILCLLSSWYSINHNLKEFLIFFLIMNFFLLGSFTILDLLLFYIFFESVLIPMFLIIGIWGSRERKIRAAYFFFLYTLIGSVFMLLAIMYIYYQVGTTNYEILLTFSFSLIEQKYLWIAFFVSFASKIPMMPFHLWLPEAHVEAPTAGSVILAGILLKLGTYGFIRFLIPLFPEACFYYSPLVYTIATVSVLYASLTAIRQTDFKRIIAYTSIAHMNLVMIGIFSFNVVGLEGALIQSISHGFVASALFLIIGIVYERHSTRIVSYYGGLAQVMPLFTIVFLFFSMANMGLPGTGSFIGEFLILLGSFKVNTIVTFLGAISMVLSGCYSLWLFNRVSYGNLKTQHLIRFEDLNLRDCFIFFPLVLNTLILGIYPNFFLNSIHPSINKLVELTYF